MARGVNKVILIGNLGKDPETKSFPSGGSITNTTLATTESWKDKQTGQMKENTEWHNLVFNDKLGEIAAKYLKKGSKIYVEGSLRTRSWEKDGVKRYTTEIRVSEMQMLDGKPGGSGSAPMDDSSGGGYSRSERSAPARAPAQTSSPAMDAPFEEDDIPF